MGPSPWAPARKGRADRTGRQFGNDRGPDGPLFMNGSYSAAAFGLPVAFFFATGFGLSTLMAEASRVFFRWMA